MSAGEKYAEAMTQSPKQRREEVWNMRRLLDRMDEVDSHIGRAGLSDEILARFTALFDELIALEPPEEEDE